MTAPAVITEQAPAKLNLYLHVLGRRADGYHELDSLVAFADVADTVSVRPAEGVSLTIDGPFAPALAAEPASDNLVTRAARLLAESIGRPDPGVAITLTKRCRWRPASAAARPMPPLPCGRWPGFGKSGADHPSLLPLGGSPWRRCAGLPDRQARVFRRGRRHHRSGAAAAALRRGAGQSRHPAFHAGGVPGAHRTLLACRRGSTGDASPPDAAAFAELLSARHNDLTAPARSLVPEIGTVLEALSATSGCLLARLSGSGATCFALYADPAQAHAAAAELTRAQPGWWIVPGRLSA